MGTVSRELDDPARRSDVNSGSGVSELGLSLANRADPARRSDVNSRSGVTEVVLSLAKSHTRLAEVT